MVGPEYMSYETAYRAARIIRDASNRLLELDVLIVAKALWELWQGIVEGNGRADARTLQAIGAKIKRLAGIGLTPQERIALEGFAKLTWDDRQSVFPLGVGPPGRTEETATAPRVDGSRGRETKRQITLGV